MKLERIANKVKDVSQRAKDRVKEEIAYRKLNSLIDTTSVVPAYASTGTSDGGIGKLRSSMPVLMTGGVAGLAAFVTGCTPNVLSYACDTLSGTAPLEIVCSVDMTSASAPENTTARITPDPDVVFSGADAEVMYLKILLRE